MASCSLLPPDSQNIARKQEIIDDYEGPIEEAVFAGGCFWCIEAAFADVDGVVAAISGYTGGESKNPTYEQVSSGTSGHIEAVLVVFDPTIVSYKELVDHFWQQIDPTDDGGQFADRGEQYTTAIMYTTPAQAKIAEESKELLNESGKFDDPIATAILPVEDFYPAGEYHQDYAQTHPMQYGVYHMGSGRAAYIENTWGVADED